MVLGHTDFERFAHDWDVTAVLASIVPSRRSTNNEAVTRSALVPGFRLLPSDRNQSSKQGNSSSRQPVKGQPSSKILRARACASSATAIPHLRAMRLSG